MNKYEKEVQANEKRVEAGLEYEKWRKEKAKEGYLCYLAYMKIRKKI